MGRANSYAVRVETASVGAGMRGRLRHVSIFGQGVKLSNGMHVDRMLIEADDVIVDQKKAIVEHIGIAILDAWFTADEVQRLLQKKRPDLPPITLRVVGNVLQVRTIPRVFGYPIVTVAVDGALVVADSGNSLFFQPSAARLGIISVPEAVVSYIADTVNPVTEMSVFPVELLARSVDLDGGFIHLRAEVRVDALLAMVNKQSNHR